MRVLKLLSAMAIVSAAFSVTNAMAAIQNVPVSCNWVQTGSQSGPFTAIITFQCQESGGSVAATRQLTYSAPSWQVTYCTITLANGVKNSGTCQSTNLYREVIVPDPVCNSGNYIGSGCANSLTASPGFNNAVQQICGTGCQVRFENLGATNGCYRESPYLNAYCK